MKMPHDVELAHAPHRNRQLFSDHYLNVRLPLQPAWRDLRPAMERTIGDVRAIYARFQPTPNEHQTEKDLIQPVLEALGHVFEVQAALAVPGATAVRPDYVFFADAGAKAALKGHQLREGEITGGLAVGDAKYWDRPLDQAISAGGDPFTNKNPGYQIAFYLQHSGLPWGILTNGRLWRLYHRDSAHRLDRYYEVDLVALLDGGDPAAFQYFAHFFGPAALLPGPLSLASIRHESADYARGVSAGLKRQVYDALWLGAEGFIARPANALAPAPDSLRQVHDNALVLLYRLLFILYAEAKGLLPLRTNEKYRRQYSLDAVKKEVAAKPLADWAANYATLWPRLAALFSAIDAGDADLGVPAFNGGLFSAKNHPLLEAWALSDAHLAQVIDRLARVDGEFIDYRDLAAQHLGTIYEGLLEYHLRLNPDTALNGWTTELVTSKGERKASGSYYTPGFITRYMVEQTLGPVVDTALAAAQPRGAAAQVGAVLEIDVLDPAMGSGHFLVEAIDFMAERLVAADLLPPDLRAADGVVAPGIEPSATGRGIDELAYWKRRIAQSCIYGVDINPLAVELAKLSVWLDTAAGDRPLSFLDHHLRVGNSLVGTSLADLSLGEAVSSHKPSRRAKQQADAEAAGQLSWFQDDSFRRTVSMAVDSMWLIEETPADTLADVRTQERLYADLRAELNRRYGRLADLVTATRFGLKVDAALWAPLVDFATGRALATTQHLQDILAEAEARAEEWRFFHWELEFPEVFFDRHGQPLGEQAGFAAVLGNPPYVRQEGLGALKKYVEQAFAQTYSGVADIYVYFYQRGLELLQADGRMSLIVTNKWMRAGYGEPLRAYFAAQGAVEQVLDFGHAPIFEDADVFPCILQLRRQSADSAQDDATVFVAEFPREQLHKVAIADYVRDHGHRVPRRRFGREPWNLEAQDVVDLMDKIRRNGVPLAEFAGVKPYYGIKTGLNEAFLIDTPTRDCLVREDPRSAEIIKPYLRGQDIKRWAPEWAGLWMIFARRGIEIERYPAIERHLLKFRDRLTPKPADWTGEEWPGRKPGAYRWYEVQDSIDYWSQFDVPKIVYQEIQTYPWYALDDQCTLTNNKAFILPTDDTYLLGLLNSSTVWWFCWRYLPHMINDTLTPLGISMEVFPIAPPTPAIRAEVEPAVEGLIAITRADQAAPAATLDWLRMEFGVEKPGQRLEDFARLDSDAFVAEVRARRPKAAGGLSPAALRALRDGFAEQATPVRERAAEAVRLERRVAARVNEAYGLTPEDVDLMWRTAPPRMPVGRADEDGAGASGA
jgi:hypothetical protein